MSIIVMVRIKRGRTSTRAGAGWTSSGVGSNRSRPSGVRRSGAVGPPVRNGCSRLASARPKPSPERAIALATVGLLASARIETSTPRPR